MPRDADAMHKRDQCRRAGVCLTSDVRHVRVLCSNGWRYGRSCYGIRIRNRTKAFELYHFQWPWTTPNPDFKVASIYHADYLGNGM